MILEYGTTQSDPLIQQTWNASDCEAHWVKCRIKMQTAAEPHPRAERSSGNVPRTRTELSRHTATAAVTVVAATVRAVSHGSGPATRGIDMALIQLNTTTDTATAPSAADTCNDHSLRTLFCPYHSILFRRVI